MATMSEGASVESTAASQACTDRSSFADPLAAGEAIDEMLAANDPDVTLPPLQVPEVPVASGTNPITAAEKELEEKVLPPSGDGERDSDVELVEGDIDVQLVDGPRGGVAEGEEVVEL